MSFITLVVVISTTIVLCQPIISNFREYSNRQTEATNAAYENKNKVAFNFLINSGKNRLLEGRISSAYKEFKLAHAIYPENEALNNLLIETLEILCEEDNFYCDELDEFLLNSY
ncbi:hypothetical protein [Seonamhaeicola maritimus]|uniref:hypothetical protein n=1 Tax=Seonamhaeicola maritimus TaxID=2591822 RepID=UPI0024951FED|nr:hypothetical protein [Seonamhaeicola maritimus]